MERQVSNQGTEGKAPAGENAGKPAGSPADLEQQLAKEREARALMRDRLRHTEALAAESHALRARMAQELERVTADRDRLRTAAASTSSATPGAAPSAAAAPTPAAPPPMTPHSVELPLRPPMPPKRSGPWPALAMLGAVALAVGAFAWYDNAQPGAARVAAHEPTPPAAPAAASSPRLPAPTAATVLAGNPPADLPSGVTALPPLTAPQAAQDAPQAPPARQAQLAPPPAPLAPETQLAAAPTAAGPAPVATAMAPTASTTAAPAGMSARLRKALDGEGIASPVDVDAVSGHVLVSDPKSDHALRDRTDMLIRAVYAGASLPEPQIEHRWMSPMRGARSADAVPPPAPAPTPAATPGLSTAEAYAARHAGRDQADVRHRKSELAGATATVADVEALRPVLPEGRVTAGCRTSLAGKNVHRADMTACMKHSCCSSAANHNAEDCRAYEKAYPFTCGA